ncbi:MAG: efflux RND transporter periplasmic adaptor subunit [Treponemataceae bacterium]|nr:MAG: efflux RND transporter periplasmic adaptor subunit [Treponemataceae bacterium]
MKKQKINALLGAALLTVAAAAGLAGCAKANATAPGAAAAAKPETIYAVNTAMVKAGNLDAYLEFGGDVAAASSIDVLPDSQGKVSRLYVKVGEAVRRNQLLADVDPSHPGMNYELSPVRAPIAGTITSLPFPVGATVAPSVSIAKISTANDLAITIEVAERFVSRIKMGQNAQLFFDAYPGEVFDARVIEIAPVLNTSSRTMTVKLSVGENSGYRIKIGMYARVKLVTDERKDVIVIPYNALVRRGAGNFVFVVNPLDTTVEMIEVTEGIRVDDQIEITKGLLDGDEVVIKGQTLLDDGAKINVISTVKLGSEG